MKEVMTSNIYDIDETIIIVGTCLKYMQPKGYEKLEKISKNIYNLCLENTHVNMAITKIGGMIRTGKVHNIIFATVDESPHCIQMHYIQDELREMMNLENINIKNYVVVNDELIEISPELILLSKKLSESKEKVSI
ncbi:conserved domain protein [Parvimonas sp. oral taxon 393 str. F0440]|nr:conserved domain protein [Parvimonas sp. oral taxon 393 str. F0440]